MTRKFRRKSELYYETVGTFNKMENEGDKANQDRALECDIKSVIEKYGIMPIELLNKAKEPLFIDNLDIEGNLNEKIQMRNRMDDYFETLPAKVRKEFNDDKNNFYSSLITGNYDKMIENGILERTQAEQFEAKRQAKNLKIQELQNNVSKLEGELNNAKQQMAEMAKNNENLYTSESTIN